MTTLFIVSFNLIVVFTCTALVLGLISRLIILFFEKDFDVIKNNLKKESYNEVIVSDSVESEDLNVYE